MNNIINFSTYSKMRVIHMIKTAENSYNNAQ